MSGSIEPCEAEDPARRSPTLDDAAVGAAVPKAGTWAASATEGDADPEAEAEADAVGTEVEAVASGPVVVRAAAGPVVVAAAPAERIGVVVAVACGRVVDVPAPGAPDV
jgi:hypothetical protein